MVEHSDTSLESQVEAGHQEGRQTLGGRGGLKPKNETLMIKPYFEGFTLYKAWEEGSASTSSHGIREYHSLISEPWNPKFLPGLS